MPNGFYYSWATVERGCLDYFANVLGTLEGVRSFNVDAWPRNMPDDNDEFFAWVFKIDGGGEVVQRNKRSELRVGAWKMDAEFKAICSSDYVAKLVAGEILESLPVLPTDNIEGLSRLYHTGWPSREWVVRGVENENRAGDERRFVELIIPMACAFGNTGRIE